MVNDKTKTFLEPTGNIFVDQAQLTLKILLKYPNSRKISIEDIVKLTTSSEVYGIDWLVQNLPRFKSFTMIYSTNSPFLQSGFRPDNERICKALLLSLINGIVTQFDPSPKPQPFLCDMCGKDYDYNFDQEYRNVLKNNYTKYKADKEERRFSTREFFPLAGSMGSESQTFSNMTLAPNICPRCLFVIYYLPFSSQVIEGNLAIFQASNINEQTNFTRPIVQEYLDSIASLSPKKEIETIGKNNKSKTERIFESIQNYFKTTLPNPQQITPQLFRENFPKKTLSFWLWKYTNSGQAATIEVEVVPDAAIIFLFLCYTLDFSSILKDLIRTEMKYIKYTPNQLYNSIRQTKLYRFESLLKSTGFKLNPKFLFLYYIYIHNFSRISINIMVKIAQKILVHLPDEEKRKQALKKRGIFLINAACRDLVGEGIITWSAFQSTFSLIQNSPRARIARDIIVQMITFNVTDKNLIEFEKTFTEMMSPEQLNPWTGETIPRLNEVERIILKLAADLYGYLGKKYVKADFQKKVIDLFLKGFPESWFTITYCRLGEIKRSISYADYRFCLNIVGGWFNLRNILRTLFTLWQRGNEKWESFKEFEYIIPPRSLKNYSNPLVEGILNSYFSNRIQEKGFQNVQRKFVSPLISGKLTLIQLQLILEEYFESKSVQVPDILKNWDWERVLINPEKGQQDPTYLSQFTKITISGLFYSSIQQLPSEIISTEEKTVLIEDDAIEIGENMVLEPTEQESVEAEPIEEEPAQEESEINDKVQIELEEDDK